MTSTFTTLAALTSLIPVVSLSAQTEQRTLVGKRVRITMPDTLQTGWRTSGARSLVVIGQMIAITDSTMSVRNDGTLTDVTVPVSRVQRLEVSTGLTRGETATIGGLIGLGAGGILGYASGEDCSGNEFICFPRERTAVAGALAGAAVGGLIGYVLGRDERWRDASVPRVSVVPLGTHSIFITSTLRF